MSPDEQRTLLSKEYESIAARASVNKNIKAQISNIEKALAVIKHNSTSNADVIRLELRILELVQEQVDGLLK